MTAEWLSDNDEPVPLANVGEADEISYRDGVENATQELERAVFVSFPLHSAFSFFVASSLWGRASAPTGCSPRDSGQLHSSWVESYLAVLY